MDNNKKWLNEQKINMAINALESNNMNGYFVKDKDELIAKINELVPEGAKVAFGGSMTLFESGVMDHLKSGRYNLIDRNKEGLSNENIKKIYKQAFFADAYFTSSNAVTLDGELYNVDGNGNRVAAMLYGPEKVIVICGANKIVEDVDNALLRIETVAAPANAKRLNKKTPCAKFGTCMECDSKDRICNEYTIIRKQSRKDRIHVIFLNEELGY